MKSLLLILVLATSGLAQPVALKVARAHVGTGEVLENVTILVDRGMIVGVGRDLKIPADAKVHDFSAGGVAMPGMIDAVSHAALARGDAHNEESREVTPSVRVSKVADTTLPECRRLARRGVTTLGLHPGRRNVIGGLLCAVKTGGPEGADRLVKDDLGLLVTLGLDAARGNSGARRGRIGLMTRIPNSRMGVIYLARRAFQDAANLRAARAAGENEAPLTADQKVMMDALEGRLPVYFMAREAKDAETALRIADEFGLKNVVLFDCLEPQMSLRKLVEREVPVLLGPQAVASGRTTHAKITGAGQLLRRGVSLGFSRGSSSPGQTLRDYALYAVRGGFAANAVVPALTLEPARILGIEDRVGSLQEGKDADVVILSGDVLSPTSGVRLVMINGHVVVHETGAGS